jgi:hypothetical protein
MLVLKQISMECHRSANLLCSSLLSRYYIRVTSYGTHVTRSQYFLKHTEVAQRAIQ